VHCFNFAGSPCEHDGICVNTPGSFACNCTQGFTGPRCETNVNECESHPCHNDGSCLDDPGTFRCVCMPGESPHKNLIKTEGEFTGLFFSSPKRLTRRVNIPFMAPVSRIAFCLVVLRYRDGSRCCTKKLRKVGGPRLFFMCDPLDRLSHDQE
jgi:hypothetical protein